MTITIDPLRNLLLVRLHPVAETTGLIHRVTHFESVRRAAVLAVGPECRDCHVGMTVLVNPLVGQLVGEDLLLPEGSVLGYVE